MENQILNNLLQARMRKRIAVPAVERVFGVYLQENFLGFGEADAHTGQVDRHSVESVLAERQHCACREPAASPMFIP